MKARIQSLLITLALLSGIHPAVAQNTVFTYQGRVTDNGTNFSGIGLFKFAIVTSTNFSSQATATAVMGGYFPNEFVNAYTVTYGGSGYASAPNVTIFGGGGSGATAMASINGGTVTDILVINPGFGYSRTPGVTVDPPPSSIIYTTYWSNDGTSNAGGEPVNAVGVTVNNGQFTVTLGDITLANMTGIPVSLFNQPNLQLRIWFDDGVNGSVVLSPVQSLTPTPYADFAFTASNLTGTLPAAQISGTVLNTSLPASPNFSGTVTTASGFSGNGANVTNVNAATLGGLASSNYWQLGGNNVAAGQFLGSTNNRSVEIRVNGQRAFLLTTNASDAPNIIAGSPVNVVDAGVKGAVIAGGGTTNFSGSTSTNRVSADFSSIGGGSGNWIQPGAVHSMIGGGWNNIITSNAFQSVVAGGQYNSISNSYSFIGGGSGNIASGKYSTALGYATTASGYYSTALGNSTTASGDDSTALGAGTTASGYDSTAMGYRAKAVNQSTFVWADSRGADFTSTGNDQFLVRAQGGVGINMNNPNGASLYVQGSRTGTWSQSIGWFENTNSSGNSSPALRVVTDGGTNQDGALSVSCNGKGLIAEFGNSSGFVVTITNDGTVYAKAFTMTSDRNAKEHFTALDGKTVLAKVMAMPVTEWNYKDDAADKKHIGPVAQDFHAAFQLDGTDDRHISVVDEGGVALAAIQGLNQKLEETRAENTELKEQNDLLAIRLNELEAMVKQLATQK